MGALGKYFERFSQRVHVIKQENDAERGKSMFQSRVSVTCLSRAEPCEKKIEPGRKLRIDAPFPLRNLN